MTMEIYFSDLTHEAQERYLDFFNLHNAKEGNLDWDFWPLFVVHSDHLDGLADIEDES